MLSILFRDFAVDGQNNAQGPVNQIISLVNTAVTAILALDVNVSGQLGPLIGQIVSVLTGILSVRSLSSPSFIYAVFIFHFPLLTHFLITISDFTSMRML